MKQLINVEDYIIALVKGNIILGYFNSDDKDLAGVIRTAKKFESKDAALSVCNEINSSWNLEKGAIFMCKKIDNLVH